MLGIIVETTKLTFSSTDTITYNFTMSYASPPNVTCTCNKNVNVFVSSISKTQAIIQTSQVGDFTVDVHVVGR